MATKTSTNGAFTLKAYSGDAKTLLAFNLAEAKIANLAGFTICVAPDGVTPYYLLNTLRFEHPERHAQVATEPATSTINAPIHKMRWVHVPGSAHQGAKPLMGKYTYTITPRYFDSKQSMLPIDHTLDASVTVDVLPFVSGNLEVAFTRGFMQSQAYVYHFGKKAVIIPKNADLLFDTTTNAGTNDRGESFTYGDEFEWIGFTARQKIFAIVNEVIGDKTLRLDMFAYDLDEPDLLKLLLQLAAEGRVRIILDDSKTHSSAAKKFPEDKFEVAFKAKQKKPAALIRGHFSSLSHDKVMIVSGAKPTKVLTGSTNFSVNGLYVNSNHVLVFNDATVAAKYAEVFESAWSGAVNAPATFKSSPLAAAPFTFAQPQIPKFDVSFAPHTNAVAESLMQELTARINAEGTKGQGVGSVFFAVMDLSAGSGPVRPALIALHAKQDIFTYGISDMPTGIYLYSPKKKYGVLVTGKPTDTVLPKPFNMVPRVAGHQVHHKFVVCGFDTDDAVVYCGSSNLANGGEEGNGDNLLAIHDRDVATAFVIEALLLVDHFDFLDRYATKKKSKPQAPAAKVDAAAAADWYLWTNNKWVVPYYDPSDLRSVDRQMFG